MAVSDFSIVKRITNQVLDAVNAKIDAEKDTFYANVENAKKELDKAKSNYDSCLAKFKNAYNKFYDKAKLMIDESHGFTYVVERVETKYEENPFYGVDYEKHINHCNLMRGDEVLAKDICEVNDIANKTIVEMLTHPDAERAMEYRLNKLNASYKKAKVTLDNYKQDYETYSKKFFKSSKVLREKQAKVETQQAEIDRISNEISKTKENIVNFKNDVEELKNLSDALDVAYPKFKEAKAKIKPCEANLKSVKQNNDGVVLSIRRLFFNDYDSLFFKKSCVTEAIDSAMTAQDVATLKNDNFFTQNLMQEKAPKNDFPEYLLMDNLKSSVRDLVHLKILDEFYKNDVESTELTD